MLWAPHFVEYLNLAMLGDVHAWDVETQADPLRRVIHLRLNRYWTKKEIPLIRAFLKMWCDANDCVYQRSSWKYRDFRALIMLKGLGPKREVNPFFQEDRHALRRNR